MDHSGALMIGAIVVVLVFLDLLFVEVRRSVREGSRLVKRVAAYAELPIFALLAKSERDVARIAQAFDEFCALLERAQRALGVLRSFLPKRSAPG
jgi:hypothetical protein